MKTVNIVQTDYFNAVYLEGDLLFEARPSYLDVETVNNLLPLLSEEYRIENIFLESEVYDYIANDLYMADSVMPATFNELQEIMRGFE